MDAIHLVLLFIVLGIVIVLIPLFRKLTLFQFNKAPSTLGLKQIQGLKQIGDDLENALNKNYMDNVEKRVRQEIKLKKNEYEWRLLDLKRYFIMTAILREAPMFSEKVDDLWHEMLMFTRDYEDFTEKYLGRFLHHVPNVEQTPNPVLRSFFDWIYSELFYINKENSNLYNGFFKHPVDPIIIDDFKNLSADELIYLYFKIDSKYEETIRSLISAMKQSAREIKKLEKQEIKNKVKNNSKVNNSDTNFYLSISYYHYDDYDNCMNISNNNSSSSTNCGSATDSTNSSCSSCGGGE